MKVKLLSRLGTDPASLRVKQMLLNEGVDCTPIEIDLDYTVPRKHRLVAQQQQLLRIDHEEIVPLSTEMEAAIVAKLPSLLDGVDFVAVSDYGKGFLTPSLLQSVFQCATVPILVDPKDRDFARYRGATYLKPNQGEALAAAGLGIEGSLDEAAHRILTSIPLQALIITRSEEGMTLFLPNGQRRDYSTTIQSVRDVTGAGDTVLAVMAAGLANGWTLDHILPYANRAAALAIAQVGCARISWHQIEEAMQENTVSVNGYHS